MVIYLVLLATIFSTNHKGPSATSRAKGACFRGTTLFPVGHGSVFATDTTSSHQAVTGLPSTSTEDAKTVFDLVGYWLSEATFEVRHSQEAPTPRLPPSLRAASPYSSSS